MDSGVDKRSRMLVDRLGGLVPANAHRVGGELFWIVLGQVAVALGALVGVRLLTGVLLPAEYGELALALTVTTLVTQVLFGPLSGATLRFFGPAQESGRIQAFVGASRHLLGQATVILLALSIAVVRALMLTARTSWTALAVLAFVFALLLGYGSVLDGVQNAARQRVIVSWHSGLAVWLRYLLAVVLVSALGAYSSIAMLGYVVASFLVLGSQYLFFHRRILVLAGHASVTMSAEDTAHWTRKMRNYAWPFAVWGIFTWLQLSSDRWALQVFASTTDVGLYTALYQLGYYPVTLLATVVMQLVMPVIFSRAGDASDSGRVAEAHRLNRQVVTATLAGTCAATIAAFFLHDLVFALFTAPEYRVVSPLLPLVVLGGGLFATGQMASLRLLSKNDTKALLAPKVGTALIGVAANMIGAWLLGVAGVAIASVVFGTVYCAWLLSIRPTARAS